ncbi:hypothetical protein F4777DRAFT_60746 [Nemania sp. FL0916]|nr:hypothetical protein F4777DRAFT_60746 [Nemania sp. FL0916]
MLIIPILKNLPVLPALLQTAVLALISASLPMKTTLVSTSLAIAASKDGQRQIVISPTARQIEQSQSFHVLAFAASPKELILAESEGAFTMKEWDDAYRVAFEHCCTSPSIDDADTLMSDGPPTHADLQRFTRSTVEQKTASDLYWK